MPESTEPTLERVLNFRDVGKTINEHLGQKLIREGLVFRSARPDEATLKDRKILLEDIGLKSVTDLRTDTEHLQQARKREKQLATTGTALSLHIEGLEYHEIKITGRKYEKFLISNLSWPSFFKFLFLYLFGYRLEAVGIIGREVLLPKGLTGLCSGTLDHSGDEIKEALMLYTSPASLPNIVHCTQGKDRTGLICALILMVLNIPIPAIELDYQLSDDGLASEREERIKEISSIGLPADWALTDKQFVTSMVRHLEDRYGGLHSYLNNIGFGEELRNKLRETLLY